MDQVYDALPKTINDVVTTLIEQSFFVQLQPFATKEEVKLKMKDKLDCVLYYDYCKNRAGKDDEVNKQFMLNDKFFDLRKELDTLVTRTEFDH